MARVEFELRWALEQAAKQCMCILYCLQLL